MTRAHSDVLYSPDLLALAVELAEYPYDAGAPQHGEAHSRSCGSSLRMSIGPDGLGMQVTACAVGQAAAAIFARHYSGQPTKALTATAEEIANWLSGSGELPDWPAIELLEAARNYPGRHGAILLPWRAALDALSKDRAAR